MTMQELRLGNFVRYKDLAENSRWEIHQINYRDYELMHVATRVTGGISAHFKPIKINEDWLEKFGFEKNLKDNIEFNYVKLPFIVHFLEGKPYKVSSLGYANHGFLEGLDAGNIEHVHELQNLYFALTKEELLAKELV